MGTHTHMHTDKGTSACPGSTCTRKTGTNHMSLSRTTGPPMVEFSCNRTPHKHRRNELPTSRTTYADLANISVAAFQGLSLSLVFGDAVRAWLRVAWLLERKRRVCALTNVGNSQPFFLCVCLQLALSLFPGSDTMSTGRVVTVPRVPGPVPFSQSGVPPLFRPDGFSWALFGFAGPFLGPRYCPVR